MHRVHRGVRITVERWRIEHPDRFFSVAVLPDAGTLDTRPRKVLSIKKAPLVERREIHIAGYSFALIVRPSQ